MRRPSVRFVSSEGSVINTQPSDRLKKEKVMRKSFAAAIAFAAIVAVTVPATAGPTGKAPRQEAGSTVREQDNAPAMTAIRKFLKRYFGVQIQNFPVIPIPNPDGN